MEKKTTAKKAPESPETRERKVKVRVPHLNIRKKPSLDADIVDVKHYMDDLTVESESVDGWLKVAGGYVMAEYVC